MMSDTTKKNSKVVRRIDEESRNYNITIFVIIIYARRNQN